MGTSKSAELELWRAWKLASEVVRARIVEEVTAATGLSDADLAVLMRIADSEKQTLRQNELGTTMRWHRSRLSHQLTRMERRGLLSRSRADGGVVVSITNDGRKAADAARPLLRAGVRRHFNAVIPKQHEKSFRIVLKRLIDFH